MRVRLVQFNFFSTACDRRAWTIVLFWKQNSGRPSRLRLRTKEETILIIHLRRTLISLMILKFPWVQYTRIRNLHRPSLNLFQFPCVMAKTMTISHHRERGKDHGLDRVSEYIVTYKWQRYHKFILWLLQNLMIEISVQDSHDDDSFITINWTTTIS